MLVLACSAAKEVPLAKGSVEKIHLMANETVKLILKNIPDPLDAFWTFEAHSQDNTDQVILVGDPVKVHRHQVQISNHQGLIVYRNDNSTVPFAYLSNGRVDRDVDLILLLQGYSKEYPVPGYVSRSPNQNTLQLSYDANTVEMEFGLASTLESLEESAVLSYAVYQHYLTEQNLDEQSFLSHFSTSMLNLQNILEHGQEVTDDFVMIDRTEGKVVFAAYPGTAMIVSVVVTRTILDANGTTHQFSSLYVSTSTYACHLTGSDVLSCTVMWYTITKIVCGASLFIGKKSTFKLDITLHNIYMTLYLVGAYVALFGHRSFAVISRTTKICMCNTSMDSLLFFRLLNLYWALMLPDFALLSS